MLKRGRKVMESILSSEVAYVIGLVLALGEYTGRWTTGVTYFQRESLLLSQRWKRHRRIVVGVDTNDWFARRRDRDERQREKILGIMLSRSSMDSLGRPPCSPRARPGPSLTPICSCTCWLGSIYTLVSGHVSLFEWLLSWSTTPC